ncbi:MAG: DUF4878 domain-containing protein [Actinomycetota bacterium]|nr:DUF4878 domain-containing protein [Actinomycetota bacterium]
MKKLVALLFIAFLVLSLATVLGCGGTETEPSESPQEVADKYMQASIDLDVDTAYSYLSETDKETLTLDVMREEAEAAVEIMGSTDISYTVGTENIEGDKATVEVTVTITDKESGESQELTEDLDLVKEGGEWKVYLSTMEQ